MNTLGMLGRHQRAPRGRGRALAAAGAGVLVAAGGLAFAPGATAAWAASGSPVCSSGTCAATYASAGTGQSFSVPAGVSSVAVTLYGGAGGTNYGSDAAGGDGAEVTANLATYPGEALGVDVGGAGVGGADNGAEYPGGVNGGGAGVFSGSGGGATDVTSGGTDLLVAGGGGGAGADKEGSSSCLRAGGFLSGGAGGNADTAGSSGQGLTSDGLTLNGGGGGQPGTTSAVGAGGAGGTYSGTDPCAQSSDNAGNPGAGGAGMTGGTGTEGTGGGGGGGYFGGGAGGAGATENSQTGGNLTMGYAGGGGGASYGGGSGVNGYTVTDTGNSGQVNGGNGEAVLSWADPVTAGNPSYSVTADQVLSVPASGGLLSAAGVTAPSGDSLSVTGPAGDTSAQGGVVTVNADGSFSYAPPVGYTGSDSFGYTVSDASGDSATGTVTLQVQPIAQAITFTSTAPSPALAGTSYQVTASGGGSGNPVNYSIDPSSTAGACSVSSGTVSFTGAGTCQVDASQAGGGIYTAAPQVSQTITVDQAPIFAADNPPLTAAVGQEYSYTFTASGSPAPSYSLSGAPSWLAFNASTGTVDGVPPKGTTSFSYAVTASNAGGTVTAGPYTVSVSSKAPKANIAAALSCPQKLTKGTIGTCSLSVINYGPQAAQDLTVAATLNADLSETSCTGSCASQGAGMFVWSAASLAAGTSVDYTITFKAAKAGTGLVVVNASSSTTDPNPLDNTASAQITIKA
jgi:hypothetical protein